uniref:ABC transporter domain-containing protein n=1 Tax=Spongospora subterranea TaxID=70186 RepID=A0A0H5R9L1_9EUKA|eukprot:CRZ10810.1 hypothetical protein [Spongospora subterranea]
MVLAWRAITAMTYKNKLLFKSSKLTLGMKLAGTIFVVLNSWSLSMQDQTYPIMMIVTMFFNAMMIMLASLFMVKDVVNKIMVEKVNKTRQQLRSLGVSEVSYLLSFLLSYFPILFAAWALPGLAAIWMLGSRAAIIMVPYLIHFLSFVPFAYLHCALFQSIRAATFSVYLTFTFPALPSLLLIYNEMEQTFGVTTVSWLQAIVDIFRYIHPLVGFLEFTFDRTKLLTLDQKWVLSGSDIGEVCLALLPLLSSICICSLLGLYLTHCIPSPFYNTHRWTFIFDVFTSSSGGKNLIKEPVVPSGVDPDRFESDIGGKPVGVSIRNVTKSYNNGAVKAVNGVNLQMYNGEIFALLGHNGAGKTSILECLMGMQSFTSGQAFVNGIDIDVDPIGACQGVGICPQFDGSFMSLTVEQNLQIFCRLKGLNGGDADRDSEMIMRYLHLTNKANCKVKKLSGGQKRKLAVGLAFCGGSNVILLDEPSSGMDIQAMIQLWDIIRSMKKGRTIILTTHSMQEAEILGDRIGIMSAGSLQCLGSNLFLKNRLGSGYTLSLYSPHHDDDEGALRIKSFISQLGPEAKLTSSSAGEFVFSLPPQSARDSQLVFDAIEREKTALGIIDYTLTPSTLEDVFLRIVREHDEALGQLVEPVAPMPSFEFHRPSLLEQCRVLLFFLSTLFFQDSTLLCSLLPAFGCAFGSFAHDIWANASMFFVLFAIVPQFATNICSFKATGVRLQFDTLGMSPAAFWITTFAWNYTILLSIYSSLLFIIWMGSSSMVDFWFYVTPALCFGTLGFSTFLAYIFRNPSSKVTAQFALQYVPVLSMPVFLNLNFKYRLFLSFVTPATYAQTILSYPDLYPDLNASVLNVNMVLIGMGIFWFGLAIFADFAYRNPIVLLRIRRLIFSAPTNLSVQLLDSDVVAEKNRVQNTPDDLLQLNNVGKVFGRTSAVRGVTVGVRGGSALAFLGVNGSGKTSAIKCMLGELSPDTGDVHIAGINVATNSFKARSNLAFVSQFDDALVGSLSARQQLRLYSRLLGIPDSVREEVIERFINGVHLNLGADRPSYTYSGGMKRKLAVAICLMSQRPVVLMDEPSTGVDPASRRHMWSMIDEVKANPSRCLLLTTHALDEAEVLCDRISIMVAGEIMCLGSSTHLKTKYASAYQVDINFNTPDDASAIQSWFGAKFPGTMVVEFHEHRMKFEVPKRHDLSIASLFRILHSNHGLPIQDLSIGSLPLQKIFLKMAQKGARLGQTEFVHVQLGGGVTPHHSY